MKNPPSLRSRRDFQRVLASGRRQHTSVGVAFTLSDGSRGPARLGLAVPSSVGGAVVRNRIKRRLRAAFVAARPSDGLDVVVRARPEAESMSFQELEREIRKAVSA